MIENSVVETASTSQSVAYSRQTISLIALCFIFSGATGLIYEVLWARLLGLVFGATTLAVSTVLAAFMGGLALGSAFASRYGPRLVRPLRVYGLLEIVIAIYALLVPMLFHAVDRVYPIIWQQFHPGYFAFSVWRFLLSSLLLLIPTTLMGATLPVLSQAIVHSHGPDASSVTRLYACNLAGAILGTLMAGFVLLPTLGIKTTIVVAAGLNVLVGAIAILAEQNSSKQQKRLRQVVAESATAPVKTINGHSFWMAAAAVSGFVTISTQVAWTRLLTMVIGSSTYAFSLVVSLFLIGLAGGAWIVGRAKFTAWLRRAVLLTELLTALSLFLSLFVVNWIPVLLVSLGLRLSVTSWFGLLALQILCAGVLILLPSILMGMVMPLVLMWASSNTKSAVALVGRTYAVNTVGAIGGAFVTGFILIPRTSTKFTLLFAAALCLIVGGWAYETPKVDPASSAAPALKRAGAIGLTAVAVLILLIFAPRLNLADLSIGAYDSLIRLLAQTREGVTQGSANQARDAHKLLMFEEGTTSTVSVREDEGTISMAINGRTNASDSVFDMPTQVMLAQIPILIAPHPARGLVIGFATGVSVGAMLQSPIESVTCVELERATIAGSRFFEHVNNKPLLDQRVKLVIDDARTYLRITPERYDIIASEPSHPWVPGVANLFTREFFQIGRESLSEDGVFVQWLQIYQLSTDSMRSVLATYKSVFPHVMVFRVGGASKGKDLILVGSNKPLNLDRLAERMNDRRVSGELRRVNVNSVEEFKEWFVCDESILVPAVAGATINTDDNMYIETTVPREAFRPLMQTNAEWVERLKGR